MKIKYEFDLDEIDLINSGLELLYEQLDRATVQDGDSNDLKAQRCDALVLKIYRGWKISG